MSNADKEKLWVNAWNDLAELVATTPIPVIVDSGWKEMTVEEMKFFFHQTLVTMSETFERATGEKPMSLAMKDFADYFAEKMKIQAPQ